MSKFLKTCRNIFEFDGDKVEVVAERLKKDDVLTMNSFGAMVDGTYTVDGTKSKEMAAFTSDLLKKRVKSFSGLTDGNGEPVTLDDVLSEMYFTSLVDDILVFILDSSVLNKETEKK